MVLRLLGGGYPPNVGSLRCTARCSLGCTKVHPDRLRVCCSTSLAQAYRNTYPSTKKLERNILTIIHFGRLSNDVIERAFKGIAWKVTKIWVIHIGEAGKFAGKA